METLTISVLERTASPEYISSRSCENAASVLVGLGQACICTSTKFPEDAGAAGPDHTES